MGRWRRSWDVYIHTYITVHTYMCTYIHGLDYVDVWVGLGWAGLASSLVGQGRRGPSGNSPEEQTDTEKLTGPTD